MQISFISANKTNCNVNPNHSQRKAGFSSIQKFDSRPVVGSIVSKTPPVVKEFRSGMVDTIDYVLGKAKKTFIVLTDEHADLARAEAKKGNPFAVEKVVTDAKKSYIFLPEN